MKPSPFHVALFTFGLLLPFVHGDVTWFDAGELTTAGFVLGVAHPTGFPLLAVVSHIFQLFPMGSLAFKSALVSALSIAAATGFIHAIAIGHGACPWRALCGVALFPALFVVWIHGTIVEVYPLNVALLACLAWLLLRSSPDWTIAAFVTGLGLGAHATFVLIGTCLWMLTLLRLSAWSMVPKLIGWGLFGALIIVYLPLAAAREPFLNWGDPSNVEALWRHLTASGIREAFADEMGAGGRAASLASIVWLKAVAGPWPLLAFICVGLSVFWGVPVGVWLAVLVIVSVDAAFSILLNPMGQADLQTGIPGAWGLALGLALAVGTKPRSPMLAALLVMVGLTTSALAASERFETRGGDRLAGAFAREALNEPLPGSVVLVSSDHLASLFLYLQGVEGMRRDLVVLVKQHMHHTEGVIDAYKKTGLEAPENFISMSPERQVARILVLCESESVHRPVYWEPGDGRFDPAVAFRLEPLPILYRFHPEGTRDLSKEAGLVAPAGDFVLKTRAVGRPVFRSLRVLSDLSRFRGVWHLLRGETGPGAHCLEEAVGLDAVNTKALLNLAAARQRQGRMDEAISMLVDALKAAPDYHRAWRNLAAYREATGDVDGAREARTMLRRLRGEAGPSR